MVVEMSNAFTCGDCKAEADAFPCAAWNGVSWMRDLS